jgi:hypothetical protein
LPVDAEGAVAAAAAGGRALVAAAEPQRRSDAPSGERHRCRDDASAPACCWLDFDPASAEIQFFETRPWNPRVGSHLALGVDGISLPMVLLATCCFVAIFSSTASAAAPSSTFRCCWFSKPRC